MDNVNGPQGRFLEAYEDAGPPRIIFQSIILFLQIMDILLQPPSTFKHSDMTIYLN
jgi:hypothetical protein